MVDDEVSLVRRPTRAASLISLTPATQMETPSHRGGGAGRAAAAAAAAASRRRQAEGEDSGDEEEERDARPSKPALDLRRGSTRAAQLSQDTAAGL